MLAAALRMPLDTTTVHVPDLDHWLSPEHRIFLIVLPSAV